MTFDRCELPRLVNEGLLNIWSKRGTHLINLLMNKEVFVAQPLRSPGLSVDY